MRVLIACEFSGIVRDAFKLAGHHAVSCDLLPTERPGLHYQCDVSALLDGWEPVQYTSACDPGGHGYCVRQMQSFDDCGCIGPSSENTEFREIDGLLFGRPVNSPRWDLMIAHPPCTYLASSGLHWNRKRPGRAEQTEVALKFVRRLLEAPIDRIALENPVGCISTRIRKPDQIIHPWQFGHPESKTTCLWLKGLPLLRHTKVLKLPGSGRWSNQTPGGQNKLGPSPTRSMERSRTYAGVARAMAGQWGALSHFPPRGI